MPARVVGELIWGPREDVMPTGPNMENNVKHMFGNEELIHLAHPLMLREYSLCGDDICGDDELGITPGVPTDEEVTCERCIEMIRALDKILKEGFELS